MTFTERQSYCKSHFNQDQKLIELKETGINIIFQDFVSVSENNSAESAFLHNMRASVKGGKTDDTIVQNNKFAYPVFMPSNKIKNESAIILLHGLNERRWDKYLGWAHYLTEKTGKAVIIFPISFHINRSEPTWMDLREMNRRLPERTKDPVASHTTFVNLVLSERLSEAPERFFLSGLQTAFDLINLLVQIKTGAHPLFESNSKVDIFAYSIGGLLAQTLYISNPGNLLTDSKLFLFCAGSLFGHMNGVSKLIMDREAYDRIYYYYTREMEDNIKNTPSFSEFFNNNKMGSAFRAMIRPDKFKRVREKVFSASAKNIYAISLKKDKVIPAESISETLLGSKSRLPDNMEVFDFNFPYSHEMPFPLKATEFHDEINYAFELIFRKAAAFLA